MTPDPIPSASEPTKIEYQLDDAALYDVAPAPPLDDSVLADIWQYDGTDGIDNRPAIVQTDDERIAQGRA